MKTLDYGDHGREDETEPVLFCGIWTLQSSLGAFVPMRRRTSAVLYPAEEIHIDSSCECPNTQLLLCVLVPLVTSARDSNY